MVVDAVEVMAIAISIALILVYALFMVERRTRRYHPVAGTILHLFFNCRRLHQFFTELALRHKTFRLLAPFHNKIFTTDPANIEYILKTNFWNYGKGQYNYCNMKDLLGDGIFGVDGLKWRHQRQMASVVFSKRSLRDYSNTVFRSHAAELAALVSEAAKSNIVIDVQDLFVNLTVNSVCQVACGVELNSISESNKEFPKFIEAFDAASSLIAHRYADISWKIKKFLNIGYEAELRERIKVVDDFLYSIISYKIEEASKNPNNSLIKKKKGDLLSRLLDEREKDQENITTKYLRDIILSFIGAGKDTTGVTLAWFMYMLCKHPSAEAKALDNVISSTKDTCRSTASIDEFIASLTDESIENMHYLHAALTETLRLYPAVPLDPKICFSDDILPDGYNVRKGDMIVYLPYAMGRMKSLWGNDAESFRPERWLNDAGIFSPESPFKFTAFQAGPRICLGKEFAYRQMKIFAAVMLRFFTFRLRDERPPKYRVMLTLNIDKGLHMYAAHR